MNDGRFEFEPYNWSETFCFIFSISNSGVATLSITDSSATSSEDASNFDSPYNAPMNNNDSVSLHSNNVKRSKQSQQVSKSNSNHSQNNKNKQVSFIISTITNIYDKKWTFHLTGQM